MKKPMLVVVMLAMVAAGTVPALAQLAEDPAVTPASVDQYDPESVAVTGLVGRRAESTPWYPNAYGISDEVTGADYALTNESVDLDGYVGERAVVYGTLVPGTENVLFEDGPALLTVTGVEEVLAPPPGRCLEYHSEEDFCATFQYPDGTLKFRTPAP